jgi:hypothetical protein
MTTQTSIKVVSLWLATYSWRDVSYARVMADYSVDIELFDRNNKFKNQVTKQFESIEEAETYLIECRYKRVRRLKKIR